MTPDTAYDEKQKNNSPSVPINLLQCWYTCTQAHVSTQNRKKKRKLQNQKHQPGLVVHVIVKGLGHQHRYHRSDRFSLAVEVVDGDLFQLLVVGGTVDFLQMETEQEFSGGF